MKAEVIVNGAYPLYGIGSLNFNESLGSNDYRVFAGASLTLGFTSNNLQLTNLHILM